MKPGSRLEKLGIDLIGGCLVAGCVSAFIWLMVGKSDLVRDRLRQASRDVAHANLELAQLRQEHEAQEDTLADRRAQQLRIGKLPLRAPTEQYFQKLSKLSVQHHLKVLQHHPLSSVEYPGLLEQRFAFEVAGKWPDIVRFLREIEQADAWADVAYLKVSRGSGVDGKESGERPVSLTISMFSSPPLQEGGHSAGA